MKELYFDTFDGKKLYVRIHDDVSSPRGVVQLSHGMSEHVSRYDDFAAYLNAAGLIVIGEDERGHRNSTPKTGLVQGDSFNQSVQDKKNIVDYIKATYPGLPVVLLGHSYGSFLSQATIERYSSEYAGVILSGTSYMKTPLTAAGLAIVNVLSVFNDADKPAKLIEKMSFGAYSKAFSEESPFNWLSRDPETVRKYEADPDCGVTMSYGFYKSFFTGINKLYTEERLSSIRKDFPILIAVGSEDPVSDKAKNAERLYFTYRDHGLNVSYKVYDGARHEILNETNREEVYKDFLDFIEKCI